MWWDKALRAAALVALSACGYTLQARGGKLPAGAERVFVPAFDNQSTDPGAAAFVSAALRDELARRGREGGEGAPARLEGEVTETAFYPSSPNGSVWRVALTVRARLVVAGKSTGERTVRREEDYLAGVDPLESEGRRRVALRRLAERVARELVEAFETP